ncbi:MAG: alanine racemase [Candidatus Bipolaricaulota bacterium]|nr:alanine racemase [Candidatus Bipolaricaulota bacterium]
MNVCRGTRVLFAVKSDGYGHGIEAVSRIAEEAGINYLGATTVEEGGKIRRCRREASDPVAWPYPPHRDPHCTEPVA